MLARKPVRKSTRKNSPARPKSEAPTAKAIASGRQAIVTKFIGPSYSLGARIKATAEAGSVTLGYDYALNADKNHEAAAMALANKFGWGGRWVGGAYDKGYYFVFASRD